MQLANGTLESCIRMVIATNAVRGWWGGQEIEIDRDCSAYVDGEFFGRARRSSDEGTASPYDRSQEPRNWSYYRFNQPH
jgi:hypothetical protein